MRYETKEKISHKSSVTSFRILLAQEVDHQRGRFKLPPVNDDFIAAAISQGHAHKQQGCVVVVIKRKIPFPKTVKVANE